MRWMTQSVWAWHDWMSADIWEVNSACMLLWNLSYYGKQKSCSNTFHFNGWFLCAFFSSACSCVCMWRPICAWFYAWTRGFIPQTKDVPVYMLVYMHKYLNWFCSQHKVFVGLDVDVFVRLTEGARYGPTLTSGPHGLSFRAQNNLRLMFIYKHTPRRTRLTNLCSLHHQLHHSFFLSVSPSLFHSHFYLPASTRSCFSALSSVCLSASSHCSCSLDFFFSIIISTPLLSPLSFYTLFPSSL